MVADGSGGKRANARVSCRTGEKTWWRSIVYVEMPGYSGQSKKITSE